MPTNNKVVVQLFSGVHGNEHCAILSSIRAKEVIKDDSMDIRLMDGVNVPGLRDNVREVADHSKDVITDLNRKFTIYKEPDKIDVITKHIEDTIELADIVIDIHNSPACMNCVLISNNGYAPAYIQHCISHNLSYLLWESDTDTIKKYSQDMNKVGITIELGGMGGSVHQKHLITEQTQFIIDVIESFQGMSKDVLKKVFTPTKPGSFEPSYRFFDSSFLWQPIFAHSEGVIEYLYDVGESIDKGAVICRIHSKKDGHAPYTEVVSPCTGKLAEISDALYVRAADCFCHIQPDIRCKDKEC